MNSIKSIAGVPNASVCTAFSHRQLSVIDIGLTDALHSGVKKCEQLI